MNGMELHSNDSFLNLYRFGFCLFVCLFVCLFFCILPKLVLFTGSVLKLLSSFVFMSHASYMYRCVRLVIF